MVNPGRSQRAVYLHTWLSRARSYAPRLLRLLTLVVIFVLFAPVQAAGRQNVDIDWSNDDPLGGYRLGDFDGDGKTDLFRIVDFQWQYSSGGTGPWTNLATDAAPLAELRFGDFNGDGMTDVFHVVGTQWRYSPGGSEPWIDLATDTTPYTDLRFGDFDGDGKTDVFSVGAAGQWRYSPGGAVGYVPLTADPSLTINDLRFGYFDGDDKIDVFNRRALDGKWRFSSGGLAGWDDVSLTGALEVPYSQMYLGDFDGDSLTDVFSRQPSGQWQYSKSGKESWALLAMEPGVMMADLRFGDFDGDGKTDVFSLGPGNQPRYSSGGTGGWQNLTPAAPVTPMPPGPAVTDIANLAFGDFNNDGVTDVFRSNGGQWQYSPSGVGDWVNLATDPLPLNQLRFGDFNGDGRTDVFSVDGSGQWRWSDGGVSAWQPLAADTLTVDQLRFGNFNNDNITDVFSREASGQWRYRAGGLGDWIPLASDPLPLIDLALGDYYGVDTYNDFDGNGITDVFSIDPIDQRGRYSPDSTMNWVDLDVQNIPLNLLRFGDFNNDGRTDIFTRTDSGQWRYLSGGLLPWIDGASDPLSINDLRFGDFNGDGHTDVFSIEPGTGRWRYSSAAMGAWVLLGPPADGVATPTFTPTPTPSATPTGGITPSPTPQGCYDILQNGDFESNAAWLFGDSPVPGKYTGAFHHDGIRAVQLGITPELMNVESYSSIRQLVNIPAATSTVTLRFWQWAFTDEGPTDNPGANQDRLDVIALSPGGDPIRIMYRARRNTGGWQQVMLDATELAGKNFYLYFNLYNDGHGGRSWIFLDNMMLEVCPGDPPMMMGGGKPWGGPGMGGPNQGQGPWQRPGGQKPGGPHPGGHNPWMPQTDTPTPTPTTTPTPTMTPTPTDAGPMADLELSKSVSPTMVDIGTVVTFTVIVTNTGPDTAMGVVVSDDLPDGLDFGGSIASMGTYSATSSYWEVGTLNPAMSATLQITATVNMSASGIITNYAQVWDSDLPDPDSTPADNSPNQDDDDTAFVSLVPMADLSLTKELMEVESEDADVVFTIVITNSGPDIATGVTVSDTFLAENGFIYVEDDGGGAYDSGTGIWTIGMLSSGMSATLTISATFVAEPLSVYTNYAQVWTSEVADPDSMPGDDSMGDDDDGTVIFEFPVINVSDAQPQVAQANGAAGGSVPLARECVELIENGGFESSAGWNMLQGPATPGYTTNETFNGSTQAMRLGLIDDMDNMASISAIDQMIALPPDASSLILSFRYFPMYEANPGPGDLQYVDIYNVMTGQFVGRALGTQSNERTWLTTDYDLTMQAGQTVRLVMAVNNDGVEGRSAMYVDNVSLMSCNFGNLVNPGDAPTPDPALGVGNRPVSEQATQLLSGRREDSATPTWMARLSAMGVLASVAGVIAFAVMVVIGTLRRP